MNPPRPTFLKITLLIVSLSLIFLAFCFINFDGNVSSAQGQIQVNAADPAVAPQGIVNLNVKINGKGFKNGMKAKWLVTGTTDPGGVTVNSTTFVSSTELSANISIADTAIVGNFDIQVFGSDGRGGKGTELFAVTPNGNSANSCAVQPLPAGISLVASLNYVTGSGTPAYGPNLGITIRARQMTLNGQNVMIVGVGTPAGTNKLEIFVIDPVTGQVLDGQVIGSGTSPQPHITVNYGAGTRSIAIGDVNSDGVPDFAAGSSNIGTLNAAVGSISGGVLGYQSYQLVFPENARGIGWGVAMGDLNGTGSDVIAAGTTGGSGTLGQVSIFSFNGSGFTNTKNIISPLPNAKKDEQFGYSIAIADITGSGAKDLIVGAPSTDINKVLSAGRVLVFPGPVSTSNYLTFATGIKGDTFGGKVSSGDFNGDFVDDLLASTSLSATDLKALVYNGLLSSGQSPNFLLRPISGLATGWATTTPDVSDVNGDGLTDVLIGAPNAASGSICGGAAYLYLSNAGSPLANRLLLSTPVQSVEIQQSASLQLFGWATAFAPGTRLFFVTDQAFDMGGVINAGQVYIYKVN